MSADNPPEPSFDTFTLEELMSLSETDLDQLEALKGEIEGTEVWWALYRLEQAEKGGETDVEETDDNSA